MKLNITLLALVLFGLGMVGAVHSITVCPDGCPVTVITQREEMDCTVYDTAIYHATFCMRNLDGTYQLRYIENDIFKSTVLRDCRVIEEVNNGK